MEPKSPTKIFPSANDGAYWKLYWYIPHGDSAGRPYIRVDSIFVGNDTVHLLIVDTSNTKPDTLIKVYNVLKVSVRKKLEYASDDEWKDIGIFNYGIFRYDTTGKSIHSVRTVCNCFYGGILTYPSKILFYESTVFDYKLKTGDSAIVEAYYNNYRTKAKVKNFTFLGFELKKQSFKIRSDTVAQRTQFAGIMNTTAFAREAIDNVIYRPNAILTLMVYFDNPVDSLKLTPDFLLY